MNEFFDKLSAAAKRAANTVSTEVSVAAEEQKVREAYQALGKLYYQASRDGKDLTGEAFTAQIAKADAAIARIKELRDRKNVTDDVTGDVTAVDEDFVTVE